MGPTKGPIPHKLGALALTRFQSGQILDGSYLNRYLHNGSLPIFVQRVSSMRKVGRELNPSQSRLDSHTSRDKRAMLFHPEQEALAC